MCVLCVCALSWGRTWKPTPVFLLGKSYGQTDLAGYSPWGCEVFDMSYWPHTHTCTFSSVSSVAQSCPTLCNPMNHSTPGLPVHHKPPEFTQTHAHRVSDAIQPSHPLSSPSPPAPNPSQHQRVSASASVLPMNAQD